jgi:hypothetical protein
MFAMAIERLSNKSISIYIDSSGVPLFGSHKAARSKFDELFGEHATKVKFHAFSLGVKHSKIAAKGGSGSKIPSESELMIALDIVGDLAESEIETRRACLSSADDEKRFKVESEDFEQSMVTLRKTLGIV